MDPRVTIITTTHNIIDKEQTDDFNLMVNLLDMQTYPEIEHLIIDNASNLHISFCFSILYTIYSPKRIPIINEAISNKKKLLPIIPVYV